MTTPPEITDEQRIAHLESLNLQQHHSLAKRDDLIASLIVQLVTMRDALAEAKGLVEFYHGEPAWDIYDKNSPEMKRINAALSASTDYEGKVVVDSEDFQRLLERIADDECCDCDHKANVQCWNCEMLARLDSLRSTGGGE